ncbi:hypothetical protein BDV12DRAFT_74400 [Aspergillus spectabilis]
MKRTALHLSVSAITASSPVRLRCDVRHCTDLISYCSTGHESSSCSQPRTTESKGHHVVSPKSSAGALTFIFFSQAMLQLPGCRPRSSGLSHVASQRCERSLLQLRPTRSPCA